MTDKQIFQLIGLIYLSVGIGILFNHRYYKQMLADFKANKAVVYLGGLFAFAIGFLLVTFHNIWVKDITVIITIIGWMALVKGFSLLVMPSLMTKTVDIFINIKTDTLRILAGLVIILGVLLCWLGFFAG